MTEAKFSKNSPVAYYTDDGADGDWVVFIHAAFVDHEMFRTQYEYFSGKYKLLAVDILGHGKSGRGDIENFAGFILEIMESLGICAAHFVGVSLGAVLAQDFANKFEDKVLSLACFGGYDINDTDTAALRENSKAQAGMIFKALISIKWFAKANKKISAYTPEAQEEFYKLNLKFKKKSLGSLAKLQKLINKFPAKKRAYPLLVGCGEHDIPLEIELSKTWAAKENCAYAVIPRAGHCANMDAPAAFNSALENFWN